MQFSRLGPFKIKHHSTHTNELWPNGEHNRMEMSAGAVFIKANFNQIDTDVEIVCGFSSYALNMLAHAHGWRACSCVQMSTNWSNSVNQHPMSNTFDAVFRFGSAFRSSAALFSTSHLSIEKNKAWSASIVGHRPSPRPYG